MRACVQGRREGMGAWVLSGEAVWVRLERGNGRVHTSPSRGRQQIGQFRADVLVVIGDDRLHSQLSVYVTAPSEPPRVVRKLSKSGGVISRSVAARSAAFSSCVREYFYGVAGDLCPHSTIHAFDSLQAARGAAFGWWPRARGGCGLPGSCGRSCAASRGRCGGGAGGGEGGCLRCAQKFDKAPSLRRCP